MKCTFCCSYVPCFPKSPMTSHQKACFTKPCRPLFSNTLRSSWLVTQNMFHTIQRIFSWISEIVPAPIDVLDQVLTFNYFHHGSHVHLFHNVSLFSFVLEWQVLQAVSTGIHCFFFAFFLKFHYPLSVTNVGGDGLHTPAPCPHLDTTFLEVDSVRVNPSLSMTFMLPGRARVLGEGTRPGQARGCRGRRRNLHSDHPETTCSIPPQASSLIRQRRKNGVVGAHRPGFHGEMVVSRWGKDVGVCCPSPPTCGTHSRCSNFKKKMREKSSQYLLTSLAIKTKSKSEAFRKKWTCDPWWK